MLWFVLLVLWPLAELFVIIKISEAIGFVWMLLLLIVSWPVGSRIIRHQGRAAMRRLRDALAAGRTPTNEVVGGAIVLLGGLLLLVPGFITDAIGLLLLLPPVRALTSRAVLRNHHSARLTRVVNFISWGARAGNPRRPGGAGGAGPGAYDVDGTAVDIDEPQLKA